MRHSLSDYIPLLGIVPRWLWIVFFIVTILLRVWVLVILIGGLIFLILILWVISAIAVGEILDDDGAGHSGSGGGILGWLSR